MEESLGESLSRQIACCHKNVIGIVKSQITESAKMSGKNIKRETHQLGSICKFRLTYAKVTEKQEFLTQNCFSMIYLLILSDLQNEQKITKLLFHFLETFVTFCFIADKFP